MWHPTLILSLLAVVISTNPTGQDSNFPDLSGFTLSPTEHVIDTIDQPFRVRSIKGRIPFRNSPGEFLAGVLLEVMGPTPRVVRSCTTDSNGRFKIAHVPQGTYRFKTTLNGYSSIVGVILVARKSDKASQVSLDVSIGN